LKEPALSPLPEVWHDLIITADACKEFAAPFVFFGAAWKTYKKTKSYLAKKRQKP
jgi:hypothetical protein